MRLITWSAVGRGISSCLTGCREIRPKQILAVTATAGDEAAEQITSLLQIDQIVIDPFVRQNLQIVDQRENHKKNEYLLQLLHKNEKIVIYVNSRQKVVQLAELLREKSA